ncbi:MAG: hypothetical protein U1E09_05195 [Methylococcales bacterium]|nr:hypothetical protein [Methylococcales bacterium]
MTVNIASINWPKDHKVAVKLYRNFMVKVLELLNISFTHPENNPLELSKDYLNGKVSEEVLGNAAIFWWNYIDEKEGIRNFQDKDLLMARLAICLLSVKEIDFPVLGEHLSWFFEVLGFLGVDLREAINLMGTHFDFSS